MALKPRKQCKHYPYLFLLNEKSFLKYLNGQHIEYLNYSGCSYSDSDSYQEGFIFSKTKLIIFSQSYRFSYIERLLDSLTEDGKLEYAPIFCSSWIVKNDSEAIKKMKISIANNRVYYSKTKEKREARKELRLNTWCCGWMDFELNKSIEDLELDHTMLSHRERKWWQKGYDDAKEDIDQLSNNKGGNQCHNDV
jgi:hypothetical protein